MMTLVSKWGFGNVFIKDIFPRNALSVCHSFLFFFRITPPLHHMLCSSLAFISGLVEFPGRL